MKNTIEKTITDPYELAKALGLSYVGDVNLEYGGLFFETSNWEEHQYATALRITDLDSGCGFDGGLMIERICIIKPDNMGPALDCCGWDGEELTVEMEIEACMSYGHHDPVDDFQSGSVSIITTDKESWEFDSWKASAHVEASDLVGYVNALHMNDF